MDSGWVEASRADSSSSEDNLNSSASSIRSINSNDLLNLPRTAQGRLSLNIAPSSPSASSSIVHLPDHVSTVSSGSEFSCESPSDSIWSSPQTPTPEASTRLSHDPVLRRFAQGAQPTPPSSPIATPPRQISRPISRLSSTEPSLADGVDSVSEESILRRLVCGTPATSHVGSTDVNAVAVLDQDPPEPAHRIEVIPTQEALLSLFLPVDSPELPFHNGPILLNISEDLVVLDLSREGRTPERHALPWIANSRKRTLDDSILAPPPGLTYDTYHSSIGAHKQLQRRWTRSQTKTIANQNNAKTRRLDERLTLKSSRSRRTSPCHELDHQPQICGAIDCTSFSIETLTSIFYPAFAFSHLARHALESFSAELMVPRSVLRDTECEITMRLGFGPPINYDVCTFSPRNKNDLRSFRKIPGHKSLLVEESLPLIIDFFSLEAEAEEIDKWLDEVIESEVHRNEFVNLIQRRKKSNTSAQVMKCVVSWYVSSKNNSSPHNICRTAMKLLMTTTLLSSVPKVTDIPDSLSRHLSPQPTQDNTRLSPIAPKFLTRQIKASIHHLQCRLLEDILSYLAYDFQFSAEDRVAIALLVAFVLELVQKAARDFAKFASTINAKVKVEQADVRLYEMNMRKHIFNRLRASVCDTSEGLGRLGEMLRGLGSVVKGKKGENGDEECQYMDVILNTVL